MWLMCVLLMFALTVAFSVKGEDQPQSKNDDQHRAENPPATIQPYHQKYGCRDDKGDYAHSDSQPQRSVHIVKEAPDENSYHSSPCQRHGVHEENDECTLPCSRPERFAIRGRSARLGSFLVSHVALEPQSLKYERSNSVLDRTILSQSVTEGVLQSDVLSLRPLLVGRFDGAGAVSCLRMGVCEVCAVLPLSNVCPSSGLRRSNVGSTSGHNRVGVAWVFLGEELCCAVMNGDARQGEL